MHESPQITDPEYLNRVQEGVQKAIWDVSFNPDDRVVTVLTAEVVDACVTTIAFLLAGAPVCSAPYGARSVCDEIAMRIEPRMKIVLKVRDEYAQDGILHIRDVTIGSH